MLEKNFLSVPVLQKTEHRYYGFLDMADIVKCLADKFDKEETKGAYKLVLCIIIPKKCIISGSEHFWTQIKEADAFEELKVQDLMKYPVSIRNPYHPVKKV